MIRRVQRLRLWCTFLVTALAACAPPQAAGTPSAAGRAEQSRAPKLITAVVMGELNALNSVVNSALSTIGQRGSEEAERLVNSGLSTLDNRGGRHARLAEAFPTTENDFWLVFPDGRMETTWKLRPNARWHDGTRFTAEDVVFTYRVSTDRELAGIPPAGFDSIDAVETSDPLTLTVKWTRPFILADDMFASPLPRHLLEAPYLENKPTFFELPFWSLEFVGTGPFKLREFARSSHIKLSANDDYVLGRPKIDEIEIRFIADPSTLIANYLAGAADLTLNTRLSLDQAASVLPQWPDGRVELEPTSGIVYYPQMLEAEPAIVSDARFRRALLHALNRQEMADTLQGGLVAVAHSLVHPDDPAHQAIEKRIVAYDFDPRKAVQGIEALGYRRGGDGLFRDPAGQILQVEMRVTAGRDLTTKTALAVRDYWQQVGVTAEANIVPQQRSQDRRYMSTFPGFYMANQGVGTVFGGTFTRLRIANTSLPENQFRANGNWSRYMNPDFDALVDRFVVTIPLDERIEVMGQMVHHITDQLTITSLFFNPSPILVNNRLQGVTAGNEGWNAHLWEVVR
jgi:peptide/nickel transport system substrate-binding protein